MQTNLSDIKRGDWWAGLTIPQVLAKGPEDEAYAAKDLTGVIATFQVRSRANNPTLLLDLRSDGPDPQISITEPTGPVVVAGRIIDLPVGTHAWGLELCFPGTQPKEYIAGTWTVGQDVVRRTYE